MEGVTRQNPQLSRRAEDAGPAETVRADELRRRLEVCSICQAAHVHPVVLPCCHSFCSNCLYRANSALTPAAPRALSPANPPSRLICPCCAVQAKAMVEGPNAEELISIICGGGQDEDRCEECRGSGAEFYCSKCQAYLCEVCLSATHSSRLFKSHPISRVDQGKAVRPLPRCPLHPRDTVSFLGADGASLLCRDCILSPDRRPGSGEYMDLRHAAETVKRRIDESRRDGDEVARRVRDLGTELSQKAPEIHQYYDRLSTQIVAEANEVSKVVAARKQVLIQAAIEAKDDKLLRLNALQEQLTILKAGVSNGLMVGKKILETSDEVEALEIMADLYPKLLGLSTLQIPREEDVKRIPAGLAIEDGPQAAALAETGSIAIKPEVVYAIGGHDGSRELNSTEMLRRSLGSWTESTSQKPLHPLRPLPSPRRAAGCAVLDSRIYVVGGWDGSTALSSCLVYDSLSGIWQECKDMGTKRQALGCSAHNGTIYACGGYDGQKNLGSVERYSPSSDSWIEVSSMNWARRGCSAVSLNARLFAIGGSDSASVHASAEVFDAYNNRWTSVAPMRVPRRMAAAVAIHSKILVVGGWDGVKAVFSCELYDPKKDSWEEASSMQERRHGAAATVSEGKVFVIGGWDGVSKERSQNVEIYDLNSDSWTAGPTLCRPRFCAGAVVSEIADEVPGRLLGAAI